MFHLEGKKLQMQGATKVASSTSTQAVIEFGENMVIITGERIEVKSLNLELGEVCLEGEFSNLKFTQSGAKKGSFLKRIFK